MERRRHNGLPIQRNKRQEKLPSFFYSVRIVNPPEVAANEDPVFNEGQEQWRGRKILREHVRNDQHGHSELSKWWFTRSSKYYSHILLKI